jgi:hypothetical protein
MTDGYYRCDRCGTFERGPIYRTNAGMRSIDFSDEDRRRFKYGHLTGEDETGSLSQTVDLCHECRKALTEWIDGGADE